jgi:integron integrase
MERIIPNPKARLFDQVREVMRLKHYSLRTEQTYLEWIKRFIFFHQKRHPREMGALEVKSFLTDLAVRRSVAASTQNQALNALVFLYQEVLDLSLGEIGERPQRLPVVLPREEVQRLLAAMKDTYLLMARLLYGTGMRLMECIRLRVKDVELAQNQIIVRDGKGQKDRVTVLPSSLKATLQDHLAKVKLRHEQDLKEGYGQVYLPFALARKYPTADREWCWQWMFPSAKRSIDPRSGKERRHHSQELGLQRAVKEAVRLAGINKPASCIA